MNFLKPSQTGSQRQSGGEDGRLSPSLYIVATPIGHAQDITVRALDVLSRCDAILAEDTRVTTKLLRLHGIATPLIAVHDHNEQRIAERLVERIRGGEALALVSDAGTPLVSDPGYRIVRAAIAAGIPVVPLPGPSSALAALILSGLPPDRFFFAGFLPPKSAARRTELEALKAVPGTLIFFESATRVPAALADMAAVLGDRPAAVAREITKLYEECLRGSLSELAVQIAARATLKGECVILAGPPLAEDGVDAGSLDRALTAALAEGPVGQAASEVAAALGLPRRQVYERALVLSGKKGGPP